MNELQKIAAECWSLAEEFGYSENADRLRKVANALDALAAQEPVSKVIVCPVCYSKEVASDFLDGETSCGDCCAVWNERKRVAQSIVSEMQNELDFLRAEVEVLRKQLHLANIDACNAEAELNSAAPQPAQSQEPVACKKCHGEGWYDEGDPDIGSAIFECDRCLGTKVEHTCGEQASCAPCEADDEREAQCDGGSCGTGGYCKACPEKRCQSGVVHCDGACHGLMPDGFAASMPPEREVAVAAAQRIGFWLSAALDDPKVRAELKADINAWFDAAMPFPQPAPPQPAPPQPEPATMIETIPVDEVHELRKIDGFWQLFAVREGTWVRSLNGYECEFVDCAIRSAAIQTAARLAAPQRMTVSREALCKALHIHREVGRSLTFTTDVIEAALRALGIEVK